jgi:FG-GAP repeat protein
MFHCFPIAATLLATLLIGTTPLGAQIVGGEFELLYTLQGASSGDQFARTVADAGDVNRDGYADLIVGASYPAPKEAGAAYVYSGIDGSLLYQWDGEVNQDLFGMSVSGAGDVNRDGYADLIVGAYSANPNGITEAGSAYVYSGRDGSLLFQVDGNSAWGKLGKSVSGVGDFNQDGFDDVIIGAPYADLPGSTDSGAAYIFSGKDGALLHQFDGPATGSQLGIAVSEAKDVNADGYDDVLISSFGLVQVFSGSNGSELLRWTSPTAVDNFGGSVDSAGDVDADGYPDLIIGASTAQPGGLRYAGSVYVYSGLHGSLIHEWNGKKAWSLFGYSVSGVGDVDSDGYADLIVGAPWTTHGGQSTAGSAFLYSGADGSILQKWKGRAYGDFLGESVSGAGDLNGDGRPELVIGAYGVDNRRGEAYVYSFHPYLQTDTRTVSAAAGGKIRLGLDFPSLAGFDTYKVLISETGIGPTNYGVDIPLTLDALVMATYFGNYPFPNYRDLQGTLDADGNGFASFTLPTGLPSSMIGNVYYFAAISNPAGLLPEFSSVAVSITIIP